MTLNKYARIKALCRVSAVVVALVWGSWTSPNAWAQEAHAGHDHGDADYDEERHVHEETHAGHDHESEIQDHDEDHSGHDHATRPTAEEVDHAEHAHEEGLILTPEQRKRFGIKVRIAGPGSLRNEVELPGEVMFNEDRVVHMVPRVAGIVREVTKSVGSRVKNGELLAVIESRELADAKAEYLAAEARAGLAEKNFTREKSLRDKRVSSEQDFLEAEQVLAETRIELRSAEQKLHALGLSEKAIAMMEDEHDESITRYEIVSPIDGVVTEKHIALGESLESDTDIFTIVDTRSVWVNLTVYTKNLGLVRAGQEVLIQVDHSRAQAGGEVSMVTPFVEESTRSATARVVLDNSDGRWIPGTFVTGLISTQADNLPVVVPRDAVQHVEGRNVVFVDYDDGFEMMPVEMGRADREYMEIKAGLKAGTPYVAEGAFQLKATVVTSSLGGHAGHGH